MDELLVIISEKNDIVCKQMYSKTSDEEYCRLIVFVYGSIDTLAEKMMSTNANFLDSVDEHGDRRISACIMPSGYKALFAHSRKDVHPFLRDVCSLFATVLMTQPLGELDSGALHNQLCSIHRNHFA